MASCDANVPRRELDRQPLSAVINPETWIMTVLAEVQFKRVSHY